MSDFKDNADRHSEAINTNESEVQNNSPEKKSITKSVYAMIVKSLSHSQDDNTTADSASVATEPIHEHSKETASFDTNLDGNVNDVVNHFNGPHMIPTAASHSKHIQDIRTSLIALDSEHKELRRQNSGGGSSNQNIFHDQEMISHEVRLHKEDDPESEEYLKQHLIGKFECSLFP